MSKISQNPMQYRVKSASGKISRNFRKRESAKKYFDEIVSDGKMGCAECYNVFYDKLLPSLNRIHGKATYEGAHPKVATSQSVLAELKSALQRAIEVQDFELAATLRDRINEILAQEGGNV
jgi:protein arginine kinase activator